MINIVNVERLIPRGATRPFVCSSESGMRYVVRCAENPLDPNNRKAVFNEYVAGQLAALIDLPWPKTSLALLSDVALNQIRGCEDFQKINLSSNIGVCAVFIENLNELFNARQTEAEQNTIYKQLMEKNAIHFLYGRVLFDHWILQTNDVKFDTVQELKDGNLVFLDASYAFNGLSWDAENLTYRDTRHAPAAHYFDSKILNEKKYFECWLKKIINLDTTLINNCFHAAPGAWNISQDYINKAKDLLTSGRKVFNFLFKRKLLISEKHDNGDCG